MDKISKESIIIAVTADMNVTCKEKEKSVKYQDLAREREVEYGTFLQSRTSSYWCTGSIINKLEQFPKTLEEARGLFKHKISFVQLESLEKYLISKETRGGVYP